jgi:hypothetical protein
MDVKVVGRFIERKKTKKRPEKDQLTNKVSVTTGPGLRSVEFTLCGLSSYIRLNSLNMVVWVSSVIKYRPLILAESPLGHQSLDSI